MCGFWVFFLGGGWFGGVWLRAFKGFGGCWVESLGLRALGIWD